MLSPRANLPVMKQTARKYANKYQLPYIIQEKDQCRCIQCFALFNEASTIAGMNKDFPPKPRLACALDGHKVLQPRKESCPMGMPGR